MYLIYGLPGLVLLVLHVRRRRRLEALSLKALESTGAAEPASLHPVIDNTRCIGCSSCIKACPEQAHHTVLGIVGGHAVLVSPGDCIGHGACKTICPVDAIKLVFGSERRGVDIPILTPSFESTVPGVFVAGEMLDWEAPTGGYLLQASFATGIAAARGAIDFVRSGAFVL